MTYHNSEQLNLFTQPIEVLLEIDCTVERAAELVQGSTSSIDEQLRNNQPYLLEVATGTWKIYPIDKKDGRILVNAAFIFSPKDRHWKLA